jgi:hypothetical protein
MKLPHWAQIAIAGVLVLAAWLPSQITTLPTWYPALQNALTIVATYLGVVSPSASTARNALAVKLAGACLMLLILAATLAGCASFGLASSPTVPVTPANQAQVAACTSSANLHNDFVLGDYVVGGLGGSAAAVAGALSSSDTGARIGLAAGAAGAAALVVAGSTIAELGASNYSANGCSSVMAPLPSQPSAATASEFRWYDRDRRFDANAPDWSLVRTVNP